MRKLLFLVLLFFLMSAGLPAQSNSFLDEVIERGEIWFGEALLLALSGSGLLSEETAVESAVAYAKEQKWRLPAKEAESAITLGEYSLVLMKSFAISGGVMYALFPTPRYAARELDHLGFVDGSSAPGRTLSGEEAVRILGRVMEWKEARS